MGQWLQRLQEKLQERPLQAVLKVTKEGEVKPFSTFDTTLIGHIPEIKDPIPTYRLVNFWDDLYDDEQRLFEFLRGQGLLYPYQIAAGMSLSVEAVEALLAALDEQRFVVRWGKQVGLNVYAKQWHTQHRK